MTRRPGSAAGRRGLLRPGGLRRRLVIAFVLVAAVSAGVLAVASYLLVQQARLQGSLSASSAQAREDLNLATTITYPLAPDFVNAYEQRGTHAVLVFPGGLRVPSDTQVNPPIPAELVNVVHQGQLGYQRVHVAGRPYLILGGQVRNRPPSSTCSSPSRTSSTPLPSCATRS